MAVALTSPRPTAPAAAASCPPAELHPLVARPARAATTRACSSARDTADDAGVYRLRDDLAIVQTVDFFTPIVDDPYDFGRIAATNALSDVYAMGGEPSARSTSSRSRSSSSAARCCGEILRGGHDVVAAAGAAIVGGHSIDDPEPKYGLAVTGTVHPDERADATPAGAPGDVLVLTKPLGAGVVATAAKRGLAPARAHRARRSRS